MPCCLSPMALLLMHGAWHTTSWQEHATTSSVTRHMLCASAITAIPRSTSCWPNNSTPDLWPVPTSDACWVILLPPPPDAAGRELHAVMHVPMTELMTIVPSIHSVCLPDACHVMLLLPHSVKHHPSFQQNIIMLKYNKHLQHPCVSGIHTVPYPA